MSPEMPMNKLTHLRLHVATSAAMFEPRERSVSPEFYINTRPTTNVGNPSEAEKIDFSFICDDVLFEVFKFCAPILLGLNIALISVRFDALVATYFKSKQWSLGSLAIRRAAEGKSAEVINLCAEVMQRLPIPQESYIDRSVIEFFERFRRLFNSNVINLSFGTEADQSRSWEMIWHRIWPLDNDNIYGVYLFESDLDCLRQFSSKGLEDCAKLRFVYSMDLLPEFSVGDTTAGASSAKVLANWLHNPRGDGLPKVFIYAGRWKGMEALKSEFSNSSLKTGNFIAPFSRSSFETIAPFDVKNNRDEVKWDEWENEAIDWDWGRQCNRLHIDFKDNDIRATEDSSDDDDE
ncbi:hypothetical protein GPALN_014900 [Globodera pallida]|nr:hypothetical protein GPALN_014900 [Globodera pallida]